MDYAGSQVALIDSRIDQARGKFIHPGTVVGRNGTGTGASVTFDGTSGVPQDAKCFENVVVAPGDRVGLIKLGSDWVIVGNHSLRTLADESMAFTFTSSSTTTSATYVDMPSSPTLSITKMRDLTQLRLHVSVSMWVATATSSVKLGLHVQSEDGTTSFDQDIRVFNFNPTATHLMVSGTKTTSATLPAVPYTLTARWLRNAGTGTLTCDTSDEIHIEAREVMP